MTSERWRQIEGLYNQALEIEESQRPSFLQLQCGADDSLREAVKRLLEKGNELGSFLETPAAEQIARQFAEESGQSWIGRRIRSYEFISLLGVGGMGEVYRARDAKLQRDVAIKVLPGSFADDPGRVSRFEQEARTLAALNHPHIGAIYGIEETGKRYALILELIEGSTLGQRLANGRPIPIEESVRIARQIAEALEAAHAKGIIHRDLKPANIKITPEGMVKILDFGLAKAVSHEGPGTGLSDIPTGTGVGVIVGTPGYMSPEQARGQAVSKQCDIWAFGCVLYEMLTGRVAFAGDTVSDTIARILEREPQWDALPENTPAHVRELLSRCLQKDTRHRLHDIADARIAIDNVQPKNPSVQVGQGRTRNWNLRLAAAIVLVAVAISGFVLWSRRNGTSAAESSVVALPAQVFGAQDLVFLTDAIPNTLSTQLGQIAGLETKVPPTSIEFETIHRNLAKVADLYGVRTCIVSSITATDTNHFVLNVQLVEPRSGQILWGRQYDGQRGSYLELARQAAADIREKLKPATASVTPVSGQAANSEAELAFREGMYFSVKFNNLHQQENFDKALAAFQRALAADPKLATADAEIAILYRFRWEATQTRTKEELRAVTQDAISEMELWANRALASDPHSSRGWSALVWLEYLRSPINQRKALEDALNAVAFGTQDSFAHTSLGVTLQIIGPELSLPAYLESRRKDPLYLYSYFNASLALIAQGRYTEALITADDGARIEPEGPGILQSRYQALLFLGRKDEASVLPKQHPQIFNDPGMQYILSVEGGDTQKAQQLGHMISQGFHNPEMPGNIRIQGSLVLIPYMLLHGQRNLALDLLTAMTDVGDIPSYSLLMLNPIFEPLRADPSFQRVVARARTEFDERLKILQEMQTRNELPKYLSTALADLIRKLGRS